MRTALAAAVVALVFPLTVLGLGWDFMPASELLGRPVVDRHGKTLGKVADAVIDVRNARVHYVAVDFEAPLGLADDLYALPLSTLAPHPTNGAVRLEAGLKPLRNAPGFSRDAWPADDYWAGSVRAPLRQFVRASELLGRRTTDRSGQRAGEIEDAVLDLDNGLVLFLLFDYDESWGIDPPALRLSPQVFSFPLDEGAAVIHLSRERLAEPQTPR